MYMAQLAQLMDSAQPALAMIAPVAVTALWQGATVALGLALCLRLTPRVSAHARFLAWLAGFTVLVALPFLPAISTGLLHSVASGSASATEPWVRLDLRWSLAIAGLWLMASLMRARGLASHALRLRRLWKTAVPVKTSLRLPAQVYLRETWARKAIAICTTTEIDKPSVIGFFAPRILIPEWLYERLTDAELAQIVLHEVEHLRRSDDWTNLLQKLALVLFPLNPALWWMERQLSKEREMACDEGVIAVTRAPRAYAACLASLAEHGLERKAEALSLGAWQRRPELVQRVHSILRKKQALSPFASGALVAALGGGLLTVSLELARCPQFVAFVPAQSTMLASSNRAQGDGAYAADAVYRPDVRRVAGFHAMEAKAVMPAAERPAVDVESTAARRAKPAAWAKEVKTRLNPPKLKAAHEEQQWIVLTSWEQIETSNAPAMGVAENEGGGGVADAAAQQDSGITSHFTMTQLVFKVVPAGPVVSKGSKSSQPVQPKAVPFRNGWLILQL